MQAEFQRINQQFRGAERVTALLGLSGILVMIWRKTPTLLRRLPQRINSCVNTAHASALQR